MGNVKHLADQRMGELERLPLAQEYALLHALFQQAQYLILMHATLTAPRGCMEKL
jgi:hypothetical protein